MKEESQQAEKTEVEEKDPVEKLELDNLTKAAAVLVGSLYVVGVLATNTYLYSLGVTDFSLLKARYIYTGALALFPIFLSILAPISGMHFFRARSDTEPDKSFALNKWLLRAANWEMLIIGFGLPFAVFLFFALKPEPGNIISAVELAMLMYIISFDVAVLGTLAIASTLNKEPRPFLQQTLFPLRNPEKINPPSKVTNAPPNWITAFGLALFTIINFAFYLSLFGDIILTKVPEQFGGALPHQAHLLFKLDAVAGARELGIRISDGKLVSEELTILFEGENIVVVRRSDDHVLQLSKDMLQAVDVDLSQH